MTRFLLPFLSVALLPLVSLRVEAQSPVLPPDAPADSPVFALWPDGKMPGAGADKVEEAKPPRKDLVVLLTNVGHPTLTLVKAADAGAGPVPAMIVCPGGGYSDLAWNKEGTEIAAWLNSIGVTAVVLKYRVPDNRDGALQDIERAVRLVRARAGEWNVDPRRVGVIGFSAGGHLCARLSCEEGRATYDPVDAADGQSPRPDCVVLVYPAYLEKDGLLSPELTVSGKVPPTFLAHTEDDRHFIAGSKLYHAALDQAGVPNQFALFPTGGHGYGLRCTRDAAAWPDRCREWLRQIQF